jgi:hypothetical protein
MAGPDRSPDAAFVEQQPVAEILPVMYRAVLDAVAELEALGHRREAGQIRADATRAYSTAWNHAAAHRLQSLRARAIRVADGPRGHRRATVLEAVGRKADVGRTAV